MSQGGGMSGVLIGDMNELKPTVFDIRGFVDFFLHEMAKIEGRTNTILKHSDNTKINESLPELYSTAQNINRQMIEYSKQLRKLCKNFHREESKNIKAAGYRLIGNFYKG